MSWRLIACVPDDTTDAARSFAVIGVLYSAASRRCIRALDGPSARSRRRLRAGNASAAYSSSPPRAPSGGRPRARFARARFVELHCASLSVVAAPTRRRTSPKSRRAKPPRLEREPRGLFHSASVDAHTCATSPRPTTESGELLAKAYVSRTHRTHPARTRTHDFPAPASPLFLVGSLFRRAECRPSRLSKSWRSSKREHKLLAVCTDTTSSTARRTAALFPHLKTRLAVPVRISCQQCNSFTSNNGRN